MSKDNKPICLNSRANGGGQPKIQNRIYSTDGVSPAITTGFFYKIEIYEHTSGEVESFSTPEGI